MKPMKIIKEINSKDCFDGTFIKEYVLDKKIPIEFCEFLDNFGELTILKELDNPFF